MSSDIPSIDSRLSGSERYARDIQTFNEFAAKFKPVLGEQASHLTAIEGLVPQHTATSNLLGLQQQKRWASIITPPNYLSWHRSSPHSVPFLSNNQTIDANLGHVRGFMQQQSLEDRTHLEPASEALVKVFETIKQSNTWADAVRGTMNQFLQA